MESVMTSSMAPTYFFYTPEQSPDARRHGNFVPQPVMHAQQQAGYFYAMPPTPTYSRPGSSSSQMQPQPQPMLMSQSQLHLQPQSLKPFAHPYHMAPATSAAHVVLSSGNLRRPIVTASGKPTIMLETDFVDADGMRLPSTPTLSSTASSTIGSPSACDVLATPLNPMFSGLDSFENAKDASASDLTAEQFNAAAWSNCASPPFTPVFIPAQSQSAQALAETRSCATPAALSSGDLLSVSACPSLSPSPSPYARSVASEQDNDFCDPRNLTVSSSSSSSSSSAEGSLSPTFSAAQAPLSSPIHSPAATAVVESDFAVLAEPTSAAEPAAVSAASASLTAVSPVDDFVPHLSVLDEFPDLESDDDFVNNLVSLGHDYSSASSIATPDLSIRSRASSSATTHSELEFFDSWESTSFDGTDAQQPIKRQRTLSGSFPIMSAAGTDADATASGSGSPEQTSEATNEHEHEHGDGSNNDSASSSSSTGSPGADGSSMASANPMPTNRRGRKQSLTEDPSKIFACDLCNRRFRRQEHLKRHYRSLHTQDKPFNCHECGKKFSRSDNLAQHARTHGAGALIMNVYDDQELMAAATGSYMPHHLMYAGQPPVPMGDDFSGMGRVLFQVAADVPGSSSDQSSDDTSDGQGKKKRKRTN